MTGDATRIALLKCIGALAINTPYSSLTVTDLPFVLATRVVQVLKNLSLVTKKTTY